MTADEFVRVARSLCPRNDALRRAGLNAADIAEIRKIYAVPRLTKKLPGFPGDSCLHELLSQYDLSGFGFTALEFGRPVMTQNGILFARRESDPLMLRADGVVELEEHSSGETEIVAENGESFLSALAVLFEVWLDRPAWAGRFDQALEATLSLAKSTPTRIGFWRSLVPTLS